MRYDKPIFFQHIESGAYNADTGNYAEDTVNEEKRYADISDTGAQTLNVVYGSIKQGSLTIRLQRPYKKPFDSIRIGEKKYRADFSRWSKVFVVSEVQ